MKKRHIALIIILMGVASLGLYFKEATLPANQNDKSTTLFIVNKGASVNAIIRNLHKEGLIRDRIAFYILIKQLGIGSSLQAGDFRLSPSMNAKEIATALTKGSLDIWIKVIEGTRKEEVAYTLSQELAIPETEFIKKAREGYLFPDTYLVPKDASIDQILAIFQRNFDKKFTPELRSQAATKGLTENQVLTLASLVERESRDDKDRNMVASILLKRYKIGMALQVDATVQYALGYQESTKTWWKKYLTKEDLSINSVYNTYKSPGIPPAPIASPGLSAIKAVVLADANTPYLFYISDTSGKNMYYARTLEEHNENVRKYLNK
ncbi:MAG: endolytic transglycosylase MltG [Candidatus Roizmanbacteria bacterium]